PQPAGERMGRGMGVEDDGVGRGGADGDRAAGVGGRAGGVAPLGGGDGPDRPLGGHWGGGGAAGGGGGWGGGGAGGGGGGGGGGGAGRGIAGFLRLPGQVVVREATDCKRMGSGRATANAELRSQRSDVRTDQGGRFSLSSHL